MEKFDYGIIGAGPGGYTAAISAAQRGKSVVLFEKDKVGGVCLNRGCIPTKSILNAVDLYEKMKKASEIGVLAENVSVDFEKVMEHKDKTVEKLRRGLEIVMKNLKITVINEYAEVVGENTIKAGEEVFHADKIIVATGSKPKDLPSMKFDGKFILSSDDVLYLKSLPKCVVIIGSGAIGIEWARIFSGLDVEVHIVELAANLLPVADVEVSKRIERIFKQKKVKFYTNTSVTNFSDGGVVLSDGTTLMPDFVLLAVGRKPDAVEHPVAKQCVVGDACDEIQLAHYAIHQANNLVCGINWDKKLVPSVIYGAPEVAWVGLREQDLEPESYQKNVLPISALGKAHCDCETDGFIKILTKDKKIVGVHIISNNASAMVHQVLIAMQNGVDADGLKEVCFAHPSYCEGIYESVMKL